MVLWLLVSVGVVNLVLEKSCSNGTYDPGIARYLLATWLTCGNWVPFSFHHDKGSSFLSIYFTSKYLFTSRKASVPSFLWEFALICCRLSGEGFIVVILRWHTGCGIVGYQSCHFIVNLQVAWSTAELSANADFLKQGSTNVATAVVNWCSKSVWSSLEPVDGKAEYLDQ